MFMLISLECTPAQERMGFGSVTSPIKGSTRCHYPSKGPMRGHYVFLMAKSKVFVGFLFLIIISGDPATYLIEVFMVISLEYTLAQTRMGFGRVTFSSKEPMRGQYVFLMTKSQSFYRFPIFNYYF